MEAGVVGCTERPFFQQVPTATPPPLSLPLQDVPTAIPKVVRNYYEKYGADVEWYRRELTVLSYNETKRRTNDRFIDFALRYAGMGHVEVFFADKQNGTVYSRIDGGSNGWDRRSNAKKHAAYRGIEEDVVDFERIFESYGEVNDGTSD